MSRAIVHFPPRVRAGEPFEVRTMVAHPMETGHRPDGAGGVVPQQIIRRFTCRLEGEVIFRAELHAAIAANPFVAFFASARRGGTLSFTWEGDAGFVHTHTAPLVVE